MNDNDKRYLLICETAGSVAWFAMDTCWMLGSARGSAALAIPTVILNLLIFRWVARTWADILVTGAMASWACMNVLWMTNDLQLLTWGLAAAHVFCVAGALMLAVALLASKWRKDALDALLRRFRRLRLREK